LSIEYVLATNFLSTIAQSEKDNNEFKAQLEELISKYEMLWVDHAELMRSHEKLVDSQILSKVAREVVTTSVKYFNFTHTHTLARKLN